MFASECPCTSAGVTPSDSTHRITLRKEEMYSLRVNYDSCTNCRMTNTVEPVGNDTCKSRKVCRSSTRCCLSACPYNSHYMKRGILLRGNLVQYRIQLQNLGKLFNPEFMLVKGAVPEEMTTFNIKTPKNY